MDNYVDNPITIVGVVIFLIGMSIFCFGKKWIVLRLVFGDRSMFSQIFFGGIITIFGLILLYLSGAFN
ncbi:hypothetical protein V6S65_13190 [Lactococcus lactis]|jgi:hypothetical protein|uniref:Uncharacterized protein n=1 Tax=Lactococcus lactis TaxID=1358 RepID=A0AAE4NR50_9LACT|nr:hypothetical protein [Lactococcus lactis]MBR8680612.1 hypothetical protein [Lactococcus lactis subsp. lactis]MBR8683010.1 hypothetical protein [Lactococcus lactis subsp. lactis]MBR8688075.1 hypothetical protein [Lactococcus lactis subsp. lactis]MBS3731226.1 hypothetical protein [Lactococcus lactis subsp. lactis]MCT3132972.1 hypothetical protein [Lactococcus lactis]